MTHSTQVRPARNGVDVPTLFATLDAVKGQPQIADFQFRATNEWISGTHNRSTIQGFYGAGQEDTSRTEPFTYDADYPAVLVGANNGSTPVEFLLHAIAACLTSGLANIAAARGVTLDRVHSTVEGDLELHPTEQQGAPDHDADALIGSEPDDQGRRPALAGYRATRDRLSEPMLRASDEIAAHDWDPLRIRRLLRTMSAAMADEVDAIATSPAA